MFGVLGLPMIATSILRRPPGEGRPQPHPYCLVTTVIPISTENSIQTHDYKRITIRSPPQRVGVLGGAMTTPVFDTEGDSSQKDYFVDVPRGVYPGEAFRVKIKGLRFLITCPDIFVDGERIVVSIVG